MKTVIRIVDAEKFRQLAEIPAIEELRVFWMIGQVKWKTWMP